MIMMSNNEEIVRLHWTLDDMGNWRIRQNKLQDPSLSITNIIRGSCVSN